MEEKEDYKKFGGDIPVLYVRGRGIAEAWENSVVELYTKGGRYHRKGPKDKGSVNLDSTMMITIEDPDNGLFFPRLAPRHAFDALLDYEMEILGAVNYCVHKPGLDSEHDTVWPYGYSDREMNYPGRGGDVDQLAEIIRRLSEKPFKRNSLMTTWVPELDIQSNDPPCLQQYWAYIAPVEDSDEELYKLNVDYVFRSRNVMQAAPMNMRGMNILQTLIRDGVRENTGMPLVNGRMVDINYSYHVSANDMPLLESFRKRYDEAMSGESEELGPTIESRCVSKEEVMDFYEMNWDMVVDKLKGKIDGRTEERIAHFKEKLQARSVEERQKVDEISERLKAMHVSRGEVF